MLPNSITNLINQLAKLPGIGPKTAARLTFYLLSKSQVDVKKLGQAVLELNENLKICEKCFNIATEKICKICQSAKRDQSVMMVVAEPLDVLAMEKTDYKGIYHILGGVISPVDGVGPEDLRIGQLIKRLESENIKELILATDPSLEGEATAMYINKIISNLKSQISKKTKITRIARGLPVGGDLEYADEETLSQALNGRVRY